MFRCLMTFSTLVALFAGVAPAAAQDDPGETEARRESRDSAREKLTRQAEELFGEGKYDEALDVLGRAYAIGKDPKTLYNIARVYEEKGDLTKAIEYYDQFVVAGGVTTENRRLAMKRANLLRGERDERRRAASERQAKEAAAAETEKTEPPTQRPPAETAAQVLGPPPAAMQGPPRFVPVQSPDNRESWRRVGIGFTALGVATAATGGVLGALSLKALNDFEEADDLATAREKADNANQLAVLADAFYVSGAVLGLTGLVVAIASWGPGEEEPASAQTVELQLGVDRVQAVWRF